MHKFFVFLFFIFCVRAALSESTQDDAGACEPISPSLTSPKTGQKAWDKCLEYQEKLIYPCEKTDSLQGGVTRTNKCGHTVDELLLTDEANPNEFPHMALLGNGAQLGNISWYCNGALISDRFILTAAHCTSNREKGSLNIVALGVFRIEDINESNLYKLSEIVRHPSYKPPSKYNDIALLKTEKPVKLGQSVVPACLDIGNQMDDRKGIYTGWNLLDLYTNHSSSIMRKITFDKYTDDECKEAYSKPYRFMKHGLDTTTQVCYGDKSNSKKYTCRNDGGGPMQLKSRKISCMYVIMGVASFGRNCGDSTTPDIYTKVVGYVAWIESAVWPNPE